MIDERLLTDPGACPSCGARLAQHERCAACHLPLQGPLAAQLWRASVEAARLLAERQALITALRTAPSPRRTHRVPPPQMPAAFPAALPATTARSRAEWTTRRVQNLLLGLGVLLLIVAAVIFTTVAWGDLGVGGRGAVMAFATAGATAAAVLSRRRGLAATAEAVGVLAFGLLLLDAYAVWRLDLVDWRGGYYWAVALAVVAGLTGVAARAVPLRSWQLTAVVAAQLPVPILATMWTASQAAIALVIQGALAVALGGTPRIMRIAQAIGGTLAWVTGAAVATDTAYAAQDADAVFPALVLIVAALTAVTVAVRLTQPTARQIAATVATAVAVLAVHGGTYHLLAGRWPATSAVGLGLAVLLAARRLPGWLRTGQLAVAATATTIGLVCVADLVGLAVFGPLGWLDASWSSDGRGAARTLLFPGSTVIVSWAVPTALALGAVAAVVAAAAWRWLLRLGLVLATLGIVTVPLAADLPYAVATIGEVLLGGTLVVVAGYRKRMPLMLAGLALGGVGLIWSAAAQATTLAALALAILAAGTTALVTVPPVRSTALAAALGLVTLEMVATASAAGAPASPAGFAALAVAATGMAVGSLVLAGPDRTALEVTGASGTALAALTTIPDSAWMAACLFTAGAAVGLMGTRADRRVLVWVSGGLFVLGSWVEFTHLGVSVAEAYTTLPAAVMLVHGGVRRRTDLTMSSWTSYGPGLALGLLPSLVLAVTDPGLARPLLLGLAALAVTASGAHRRLQAPLIIGGVTLTVDAVAQVAPYAAALPRWVTIAAAGLALVLMGATYERRLRDLHRLRGHLGRMA
jgi:hypothetical protein